MRPAHGGCIVGHRRLLRPRERARALRDGSGRSRDAACACIRACSPSRNACVGLIMMFRSITRSVRNKLLLAVLATTGCALLITAAAVAYYDLRRFRETLVSDV